MQQKASHSIYSDTASQLAEKRAAQDALKPMQLLSKKANKARHEKEIMDELIQFEEKLISGAKSLKKAIQTLAKEDPSIELPLLEKEWGKLLQLKEELKDLAKFRAKRKKFSSLGEMVGISRDALKIWARAANRLLEEELAEKENMKDEAACLEEVINSCYYLLTVDPRQSALWFSLGRAEFSLNHYDKALKAFQQELRLDPEEPIGALFSCGCLMKLGAQKEAMDLFEKTRKNISNTNRAADLKQILEKARQLFTSG